MNAWELLGETRTPDGSDMSLTARAGEFVIRVSGKTLMSSRQHGSEEVLAEAACKGLRTSHEARVLVGGLGMGFTVRATLDLLAPGATVTVAELVPAVVDWNRGPLGPLADHPLADDRTKVRVEDVSITLREHVNHFNAILLDVDNGPTAFTTDANNALYENDGVAAAHAALKHDGTLAVWSAWDDRKFEHRLRFHGFDLEVVTARSRSKKGGAHHVIFVGRKSPTSGR